ncbi:hypothetical protein C8A03DRAFT_13107 [Achaetomium macrosporum]|uniref:Uncharacterized protein n=1 Tax=Achaetomium macrosporum TaxID=79813 RepID=A0AAN7CEH4_9PEZI|nr:hypothetical protein C8A03DRAFT_13107 [Achaetomium macrosporum]
MATVKRTTVTPRNSRRRAVPNPLTGGGIVSANCGASFLSPTRGLSPSYLDTITITYRSAIANPALSCWCGAPGRATQKFKADNVSPFNGSAHVLLNFTSDGPCWFELASHSGDCRVLSESFLLSPNQHASDDVPTSTWTRIATSSPPTARKAAAVDSQAPDSRGDSFNAGAKAALGIGIALICIAIGAMAAFLYFRRRRRGQDGNVTGGISGGHDRRNGRKGPEKRNGALSNTSDEPLCPIQPVFDGYPGSTGYDDVRSLHSTTHTHSPSPTAAQSPTHSQNGAFWTQERSIEREELTAARLKAQLNASGATVVSYGPNPVTPTLAPRITPKSKPNPAVTPITPCSAEAVPYFPDYTGYSIPPPSAMPHSKPSPPKKPAVPLVVSYGPNKVTPTPLVVSPTVPPDEALINRKVAETNSAASHERQFSWEADSPLLGVSMGPLPPYASTEDFEAMEKGAVRKLAEPQAEAELPPTKDGFYHYTSDIVEYELPGAAPGSEPQLPFRPYQPQHAQAGPSSGGRNNREIDEQKFLLSDAEISRMRVEKAKARAAAAKMTQEEGESYDLGEPFNNRR